ncbi:MAG: hypothetical protein N3A58_08790 [Spirochaetes bacterium]|nr:hypothetical protein [Spirochaetota bacterium]
MRYSPMWEKLVKLINSIPDYKLQNILLKINDKELGIIYQVGDERINSKIRSLTGKIKFDKILEEQKVLKHQFVPKNTFEFIILNLIHVLEEEDDYKKSSIYLKPKDK